MFLQNVTKVIEGSPETEAGADNLHYVKDMVDRACALFRGGQRHELETLTDEISDAEFVHLVRLRFLHASVYAWNAKRN